ncbi:MAG: hypothetical protein EBY95_01315 [Actinobacteria bacterium]|nr:hypothetical protein [Actinomycetota bacterium]
MERRPVPAAGVEGKEIHHRADLHATLRRAVEALDPQCLQTNRELADLDSRDAGVTLRFRDGSVTQADWAVGADGIHSTVRAALFGPDRPNFTGYVAWRGLIPGDRVPPDLLDPPLGMTVGPRRLLMRYPLRRGALVNFVAVARRDAWTEEGWSVAAPVSELMQEFADFDAHVTRLLALTPADKLFRWGLFDRDPLPTWTAARTTLLGDAAHAMPPFTGQGAVMALEDAVGLERQDHATPLAPICASFRSPSPPPSRIAARCRSSASSW